jgi:general secretion pathway protein G
MRKEKNMRRRKNRSRRPQGFTLIEVLLVLAILVILASLVTVSYVNIGRTSRVRQAEIQLGVFKEALGLYQVDIGSFPYTNQGLEALRTAPGDLRNPAKWNGPYLSQEVPLDPWEMPYQYEGQADYFKVWSSGLNGENENGAGDDILVYSQ